MKRIKAICFKWILGKEYYNDLSWFANDHHEILKIKRVNAIDTETANRLQEDIDRLQEVRKFVNNLYY